MLHSKKKIELGPVALVMPSTSNLQHSIYEGHRKGKEKPLNREYFSDAKNLEERRWKELEEGFKDKKATLIRS